jgi:hypothetical protein
VEFYFYFDILQLYIYYLRYWRPSCGISVLHLQLYIYYLMYSRPPCGISLLHMHLYIWHYNIYKILFTVVWLSCFLTIVLSILLRISVSVTPLVSSYFYFCFHYRFPWKLNKLTTNLHETALISVFSNALISLPIFSDISSYSI